MGKQDLGLERVDLGGGCSELSHHTPDLNCNKNEEEEKRGTRMREERSCEGSRLRRLRWPPPPPGASNGGGRGWSTAGSFGGWWSRLSRRPARRRGEFLFQGLETKQQAEDVFHSLVAASGKLQLLHKLLPRLKERGNRVLIFSQMTMMLDILEDFLVYLGYKYARIDGQTSLSARQESIKEYNRAERVTFIFLMSTRAGGLGVDLPGADRVIIYVPDFNPFMDLQAQSRAHRIGQTRPVVVYQLITKSSVEEKILQNSKRKLAIESILMNSSKKPDADELQSILLHGAKTIIDRKKFSATSIHYDDEAIDNLLKLDPSSEDKCSKEDNGYLGSIVSFDCGVEDEEPGSPKVEDLKVLKPVTPKVDLGRGKRQRRVVNYNEAVENSDSDDMYAPEGSSSSRSSDEDNDNDYEVDSVVPALEAQAPNLTFAIEAPGTIPAVEALKGYSSRSSSSSSLSDDNGDGQ